MTRRCAAAALAFSLCAPVASSATAWQLQSKSAFDARALTLSTGAVDVGRPLPSDPNAVPALTAVETRLRLGSSLGWVRGSGFVRSVSLAVQADVFHGPRWRDGASDLLRHDRLAQRPTGLTDPEQLRLRQFRVQVDTELGRLSAGRMLSNWGLGLLAQSGTADPYQFGVKRDGVIVDRVQLASAPLLSWKGARPTGTPLFIVVAADRVVFDDLADLRRGDEAYNIVGALLYRGAKVQAGGYVVQRWQTDELGLKIEARAMDVYARWSDTVSGWKVSAATELLMLTGETTYFRTATNPDLMKVHQMGGVLRLGAERGDLGIRLETGIASGDDAPFDDTVSNLKFSSEYRVGLLMFHEGMRRTTAVMAANLDDPRYVGQAPVGFERAASNGSVSSAHYIAPTVRYRPLKQLTLLAGLVYAHAPVPVVDAYQSGLQGGAAIGPVGGAAGTGLGWEVDAAVQWKQRIGDHLALLARADVGRWQPGDVFNHADGSAAAAVTGWMGRLTLQGRW